MFDRFRLKSKGKAVKPQAPNSSPPPSYHSANTNTFTAEKTATYDAKLNTVCACHVRYQALKSSIEEIYASYLALPAKVLEQNHTIWAIGRIKALLGIVRTPASPCAEKCECHSEYKILKTNVESDKKAITETRKLIAGRSSEQIGMYERFFGEVLYLHGMLRDCAGKS